MKAKMHEIVLFYMAVFFSWQIMAIAGSRAFPSLTGLNKAIVFSTIFSVMCLYGKKYVCKKFNKYW